MAIPNKQKLEDFIKLGQVLPASHLAKAKEEAAKRAAEFTRSAEDEERHKKPRSAPQANDGAPTSLTYTRDPLEG